MRVLIVASFNKACFAPFIVEQGKALQELGCEVDWPSGQRDGRLCEESSVVEEKNS